MFGLNEDKKGDEVDFSYDVENNLRDPKKLKEAKDHIEAAIQKIKTNLRSGDEKENFDKFGVLLHGYLSMKKVMDRCLSQ
jgi:hypothetical protein